MSGELQIQYRYVRFGTSFVNRAGARPPDFVEEQSTLYENELAVDVGGCCWGNDGCDLAVIDHHFTRTDQYPCASAAVLHLAARIREHFRDRSEPFDNIWLVAHQQADFDAFCAMYLARHTILSDATPPNWRAFGLHPDGWMAVAGPPALPVKVDWFAPNLRRFDRVTRWQVLLAAFASHVDNAAKIHCPLSQSLQSVLYAALQRGRPYEERCNGAMEFFDAARQAIEQQGLNPLLDAIFARDGEFGPELELLARDRDAYQRDVARARKALVSVPRLRGGEFDSFYERAAATALIGTDGQIQRTHLLISHEFRQLDGIYMRDPESLMFWQWARQDLDNSPLGKGFNFTAVAHSGLKEGPQRNATEYHFALDPERADGCCLYGVWAALQKAEVEEFQKEENHNFRNALLERERKTQALYTDLQQRAGSGDPKAALELASAPETCCRPGYEGRAGSHAALFDDPWFDGVNYRCTIVPSPNRGSLIGPSGCLPDLTDDPVARIVQHQIESAFYDGPQSIWDYPAVNGNGAVRHYEGRFLNGQELLSAVAGGYFRFGSVPLKGLEKQLVPALREQLARDLWSLLIAGEEPLPPNFMQGHTVYTEETVGVWNVRGVMIAFRDSAKPRVESLQGQFATMAALARELNETLHKAGHGSDGKAGSALLSAEHAEDLLLRIASFEHDLIRSNVLLHRMCGANELRNALATVRDLHSATVERNQRRSTELELGAVRQTQEKIEWIEVLIVTLYSVEIVHIVADMVIKGEVIVARVVLVIAALFGYLAYRGLVAGSPHGESLHAGPKPNWALRSIPKFLALLMLLLLLTTFVPMTALREHLGIKESGTCGEGCAGAVQKSGAPDSAPPAAGH